MSGLAFIDHATPAEQRVLHTYQRTPEIPNDIILVTVARARLLVSCTAQGKSLMAGALSPMEERQGLTTLLP